MIILVIILWLLAAVCNALMDVLSHHFEQSIFYRKNPYIWNPVHSWKNKYNGRDPKLGRRRFFYGLLVVHPAFTDAWHFAKSLMIVLITGCVVMGCAISSEPARWYELILEFVLLGLLWNTTFTFFYDVVFRKKKEGQ